MAIDASRLRPDGSRVSRLGATALDRLNDWDRKLRRFPPVGAILRYAQAPVTRDVEGSRFLVGPAVLGTLATLLVTVGVSQPDSPFVSKHLGAWFFGVSPTTSASTGQVLFGLVCVYGGLVLFIRVWLGVMRAISQSQGVAVRKLAWLLVLWSLPVLVAPPLFSHDIYSYAAQGEMMSRHISPYEYAPSTLGLGANPFTRLLDPFWVNSPSPYGPLFLEIAGVFTSLSAHNVLAEVALLRLLEFGGVILIAVFLPSLARSLGRDPALAFGLAVLNPVTMFHLIGGAHNDALMVGLLVAGLALAKRNHPVLGIVACALAASVKVPAAIGIVYIGWEWVRPHAPLKEKVRPLVSAVLIGGAVMGFLSLVSGLGWGWVMDLTSPDSVRSWLAPATGSGIVITHLMHLVGASVTENGVLAVTQVLGVVAALSGAVVLLLRADRIGSLKAMGLTLLLVVVLGPVVQPWYLSWALVLLAPVATGWMRRVLVVLSVAAVFMSTDPVGGQPGGQQLLHYFLYSDPLLVAAALLVLLAIFLAPLGRVASERTTAPHDAQPLVSNGDSAPAPDRPVLALGALQVPTRGHVPSHPPTRRAPVGRTRRVGFERAATGSSSFDDSSPEHQPVVRPTFRSAES